MSTAPTGQDVSAAYSSDALIARWLPEKYKTEQVVGDGPSDTVGLVSIDDVTELINEYSRDVDATLWQAGLQTPFPAISGANPSTPPKVQRIVTYRVAADVAAILRLGSKGAPRVKTLTSKADALEASIKASPHSLGHVRVTTPENFQVIEGSGSGSGLVENGQIYGPWFRLKNRNVIARTIYFVNAQGKELARPSGGPFIQKRDWAVVNAAEGVISVYNTEILTQTAGVGGVIYDWGWVRLDRFQFTSPARLRGVGR